MNLAPFADEKSVLKQRRLWRSVVEQIEAGNMPPEDQKQPAKEQRERLTRWVKQALAAADKADREQPDPGRAVIRRLNRSEYNRTIRDLTGIDFDVAGAVGMPDENTGSSFDNLAAALNFPSARRWRNISRGPTWCWKSSTPRPKTRAPRERILMVRPLQKLIATRPGDGVSARDAAKKVVESFARRAYRRPVEAREIDRFLSLFDRSSRQGTRF